jgi:hypothetical protein
MASCDSCAVVRPVGQFGAVRSAALRAAGQIRRRLRISKFPPATLIGSFTVSGRDSERRRHWVAQRNSISRPPCSAPRYLDGKRMASRRISSAAHPAGDGDRRGGVLRLAQYPAHATGTSCPVRTALRMVAAARASPQSSNVASAMLWLRPNQTPPVPGIGAHLAGDREDFEGVLQVSHGVLR